MLVGLLCSALLWPALAGIAGSLPGAVVFTFDGTLSLDRDVPTHFGLLPLAALS